VHSRNGWVQGYNAQAVTTCEQVIVAAELTQHTSDLQQLRPMLAATTATLQAAGIPSDGLRAAMTARLASADGTALYALRRQTIEPVFGQIKDNRGARRFTRRGLAACEAEWRLLGGTHNLLKLWRHTRSRPAPTPLAT
jgi:hypothetical protein